MPITPFQAFRLNKSEYEILRVVEGKIDEYLETNYYPGMTVTVELPSKTVTDRILHSIMQRYGDSGWTVEPQKTAGEMIVIDFVPNNPSLD